MTGGNPRGREANPGYLLERGLRLASESSVQADVARDVMLQYQRNLKGAKAEVRQQLASNDST